jgi:hypothetical protein
MDIKGEQVIECTTGKGQEEEKEEKKADNRM